MKQLPWYEDRLADWNRAHAEADDEATNVYDKFTHARTTTNIVLAPEVYVERVACTLTKEEYDALHTLLE